MKIGLDRDDGYADGAHRTGQRPCYLESWGASAGRGDYEVFAGSR
jgi:hypothetical protein